MAHNLKIYNPFDFVNENLINDFFSNQNLSLFNENRKLIQFPKINISDKGAEIIITANIPGVPSKNISIDIEDSVLSLSGHLEREEEEGKSDSDFYRFEREEGSFLRKIALPSNVEKNNVNAKIKNGVLTVTLKKLHNQDKPKIHIKEE